MNTDNFLLELKELPYDRNAMVEIFNHARPYARLKGLKWRDKPKSLIPVEDAKCVVIQWGENMMLDPTKSDLSYDLLQHDYIKNIMNRLNFSHPINAGNLDIIWYRPGFRFEPHTDHYASATMMWPIIPEDAGAPIDFYYSKNAAVMPGVPNGFDGVVTEEDIIYTHNYSTEFPCIFNSHWIHGVRTVNHERVYLRLRLNEPFESIREKYLAGTLIK